MTNCTVGMIGLGLMGHGIATNIANSARLPASLAHIDNVAARARANRWLTIPPATAAEAIVHGIEHRKARVLIGWSARLPDVLVRIFPGSYTGIMRRIMVRATPDNTGSR